LRLAWPAPGLAPVGAGGQLAGASHAASAARTQSLQPLLITRGRTDKHVLDDEQHQAPATLHSQTLRTQLNLELARLTSELAKEAHYYAERPRVNYLDALSAKTALEAAYIGAWVDKVENIGNLYYPDEARRRKLAGKLILHVLVNSKGNLVNAFIGSPSGQQVLDHAAMRIVKLAAPFKPFSPKMREQYDQLMITRTWIFKSDAKLTTR
jgi:protein TonB